MVHLAFSVLVMPPMPSEQRKQLDDLKKFKNDFRVSTAVQVSDCTLYTKTVELNLEFLF